MFISDDRYCADKPLVVDFDKDVTGGDDNNTVVEVMD